MGTLFRLKKEQVIMEQNLLHIESFTDSFDNDFEELFVAYYKPDNATNIIMTNDYTADYISMYLDKETTIKLINHLSYIVQNAM